MSSHECPRWADQTTFLSDLALQDLVELGEVRPTLLAFRGEDPLMLATLRPFDKGAYHDPLIELGALTMALGANRLAVSFGGRAWSLHDPIPPVLPDAGDLRQRVVVVHEVDATRGGPTLRTRLWPVGAAEGADVLGDPVEPPDGSGWIVDALSVFAREALREPPGDVIDQLLRVEGLGHLVAWADAGLARLERAAAHRADGGRARDAA